ncbi:MAG TPA: beta-L-arabinofuranosidase domain-containing protein [Arachidicoccus sp.]|nr:beta-L-arabinofuranosidase domain-containing protein [Arachidicoccus sp.]
MKSSVIFGGVLMFVVAGLTTAAGQSTVQQKYPLNEVRLLESPFLQAETADLKYMMQLDPDRLLAPYLREAGLPAKAESYGNWESMGLDGHTAGHYLTALAQMYASLGDKECKERLDYMISELARCQEHAKNGYIGGVPGGQKMWALVKTGDFSLFYKKWVPWYNLHKLFAGLRDAYEIGNNQQAKTVLIKLSDWAVDLLSGLSDMQMQKMLQTEYGGMNAVFADVYSITRNPVYLKMAKRFSQKDFIHALADKEDKLTGLHANTQIPKIIGFERIANQSLKDSIYGEAASFFWNTVVTHRTVSFGGNSVKEHFNPIDDFSSMIESVQGPETCNSYNMLKLTEDLFLSSPNGRYMDYYEKTMYNHILSTIRRSKGGFVYFTPVRPREYRVYSVADNDFWCCVGTGMENHGKYGEMIYTHQGKNLYLNLFVASELNWKEQGIRLTQQNRFPYDANTSVDINLKENKEFTFYIRRPQWLKGPLVIKINGKPVAAVVNKAGYAPVHRIWHDKDHIEIALPMKDRMIPLPDNSGWVSFEHGPVILGAVTDTTDIVKPKGDGGRFDHIAPGPLYDLAETPILKIDSTSNKKLKLIPVNGKPMTFNVPPLVYPAGYTGSRHLKLVPFFDIHDSRYMIYWPVAQVGAVKEREQALAEQDREVMRMSLTTIDQVTPGEQQPEIDHTIQSENSVTGVFKNRHWRSAENGYFAYNLKIDSSARYLRVAYFGKSGLRGLRIYINNKQLPELSSKTVKEGVFYSLDYPVDPEFRKLSSVNVKFADAEGQGTGRIFDVRVLK